MWIVEVHSNHPFTGVRAQRVYGRIRQGDRRRTRHPVQRVPRPATIQPQRGAIRSEPSNLITWSTRDADILEAAGATKIYRVYPEKVTGNCSHQHGTARMGDDPAVSVLNRWCQAHEVDNLFVVDGAPFPTGTGANPTLTIMANAWRVADHIADTRGADRATDPS